MGMRVRTGKVMGRDHLLDGRNCQDALHIQRFEVNGNAYLVGVVADGCGEGAYSEVGARLAVSFVCNVARHYLSEDHALVDLPDALFERLKRFFHLILDDYAFYDERERVGFVHDHLLFTLIGFVITPQHTLIFAWGDGLVLLNDEILHSVHEDAPSYPGYEFIGLHKMDGTFTRYSLPTAELCRLAIGSDGWIAERDLLEQVWRRPSEAGLQLLMNKWSDERHFRDDASLITVERDDVEEEGI